MLKKVSLKYILCYLFVLNFTLLGQTIENSDNIFNKKEVLKLSVLDFYNFTPSADYEYLSLTLLESIIQGLNKAFSYQKVFINNDGGELKNNLVEFIKKSDDSKIQVYNQYLEDSIKSFVKVNNIDIIIFGYYKLHGGDTITIVIEVYSRSLDSFYTFDTINNSIDSTLFSATDKIVNEISQKLRLSSKNEKGAIVEPSLSIFAKESSNSAWSNIYYENSILVNTSANFIPSMSLGYSLIFVNRFIIGKFLLPQHKAQKILKNMHFGVSLGGLFVPGISNNYVDANTLITIQTSGYIFSGILKFNYGYRFLVRNWRFLLEIDYLGYYVGYLPLSKKAERTNIIKTIIYNPTFTFRFDVAYLFNNGLILNTGASYQYYLDTNVLWHNIGWEIGVGVALRRKGKN